MYTSEIKLRVRYSETDKMGYCHHSNYAQYFEMGRTELMRELGISYLDMENRGVMLPVLDLQTKFLIPAYYDDELTVKTHLKEYPGVRITFHYETFKADGTKINTAKTTLAFVNAETMRPIKPPTFFLEKVQDLLA
ncbi:MAG: acyl-CoA thioesterase [Flavobacteriales bacterium]|jgi:acyl-CoA thioester hydrolase|nr:acyl-CoA thioesterase [Flavobacteriales bacterium]